MAYTYLILNIVFAACIIFMLATNLKAKKPDSKWWITLAALLALTLVFDNVIIWAGIVEYDATKILGIHLGKAPIEDFFYAILAVIIVPLLWQRFAPTNKESNKK